jgi:hypothetical protein
VQAGWSSTHKSAAFDEQYHLAAGLQPICAPATSASPPTTRRWRAGWRVCRCWATPPITLPTDHPSWQNGDRFLFSDIFLWESGNDAQSMLLRARAVMTLLGVALVASIFFAARQMLGASAGWLALLLAIFEPNLIAHSRFVTTDLPLTLFIFTAVWWWWRWLVQARWRACAPGRPLCRAVDGGEVQRCTGLGDHRGGDADSACNISTQRRRDAEFRRERTRQCRHPLCARFAPPRLCVRINNRSRRCDLASAAGGAGRGGVAAVAVLWALYRFTVGPVDFLPGWLPLPAPHYWQWFWNTVVRIIDLQGARVDFFMGEASNRYWWHYFFVAAGVKLPLPVLLLALTGFVLLVRDRSLRRLSVLWLPPALLLLLGATQVLNIGFRHMLPGAPVSAAAGRQRGGAPRLAHSASAGEQPVAATLLVTVWLVFDVARIAPHYESFFQPAGRAHGRTGATSWSIPTWTGGRT